MAAPPQPRRAAEVTVIYLDENGRPYARCPINTCEKRVPVDDVDDVPSAERALDRHRRSPDCRAFKP